MAEIGTVPLSFLLFAGGVGAGLLCAGLLLFIGVVIACGFAFLIPLPGEVREKVIIGFLWHLGARTCFWGCCAAFAGTIFIAGMLIYTFTFTTWPEFSELLQAYWGSSLVSCLLGMVVGGIIGIYVGFPRLKPLVR